MKTKAGEENPFARITREAKGVAPDPTPEPPETPPPPTAAPPSPAPPEAPAPNRGGRPKGKKSDKDYEQVTAYVRRELYGDVRAVLWKHHDRREFSDLIGELLAEWLKDQPGG